MRSGGQERREGGQEVEQEAGGQEARAGDRRLGKEFRWLGQDSCRRRLEGRRQKVRECCQKGLGKATCFGRK